MVDYTQFKIKEPAVVLRNNKGGFNLKRFFIFHQKVILIIFTFLSFLFILIMFINGRSKTINLSSENVRVFLEENYSEYAPFEKLKRQPDAKTVICHEPEKKKENDEN